MPMVAVESLGSQLAEKVIRWIKVACNTCNLEMSIPIHEILYPRGMLTSLKQSYDLRQGCELLERRRETCGVDAVVAVAVAAADDDDKKAFRYPNDEDESLRDERQGLEEPC